MPSKETVGRFRADFLDTVKYSFCSSHWLFHVHLYSPSLFFRRLINIFASEGHFATQMLQPGDAGLSADNC